MKYIFVSGFLLYSESQISNAASTLFGRGISINPRSEGAIRSSRHLMLLHTYKRKHGLSRFSNLKFAKLDMFPGKSPLLMGIMGNVSITPENSLGIPSSDFVHVKYFFIMPG